MSTVPTTVSTEKKGNGCRNGCLIILVIFLLMFVGVWYLIKTSMTSLVETITTTNPVAVTIVPVDPQLVQTASTKYQQLVDAMNAGSGFETRFSAEEINTLIAGHPDFELWRGKLFVGLNGDSADLRFNFPLGLATEVMPALTWIGFDVTGRYINGRTVGTFSMKGDELLVKLNDLEFNGEKAGAEVLREINSGLAKKRVIQSNGSETERSLEKLELAEVKDGQLILRTRGAGR